MSMHRNKVDLYTNDANERYNLEKKNREKKRIDV